MSKSRPEDGISGLNFSPSDIDQWEKHEIALESLDEIWSKYSDSIGETSERNAFLWLDVEGHEHEALKGAKNSLNRFLVTQIEINLHDFTRKANYREVFRIMRSNGFVLVFTPLHPGYFGDAVFIHKSSITKRRLQLRGALLRALTIFLHSFLYPKLGKPRNE